MSSILSHNTGLTEHQKYYQFRVELKLAYLQQWKSLLFQYSTDTAVEGDRSDTAG